MPCETLARTAVVAVKRGYNTLRQRDHYPLPSTPTLNTTLDRAISCRIAFCHFLHRQFHLQFHAFLKARNRLKTILFLLYSRPICKNPDAFTSPVKTFLTRESPAILTPVWIRSLKRVSRVVFRQRSCDGRCKVSYRQTRTFSGTSLVSILNLVPSYQLFLLVLFLFYPFFHDN